MISSMMMSVDARCSVSGANWGGRELQWSENGMWQVGADEVQGGWPGNQLSFFIRLEVPPPSCIEEVDFWVRGLSVDPPFGSRTCGKGLEGLQEEWQTPYRISSQVQLGRIYPAWRGPGGLEEKRNCVEGEMWGHGRGQREGQKPLRGGRF